MGAQRTSCPEYLKMLLWGRSMLRKNVLSNYERYFISSETVLVKSAVKE